MAIGITNKPYKEMITNFSKSLTYTPVTKTTTNLSGAETLTDGTASTIKGAFYKEDEYYKSDKEALFQGADAILKVHTTVTLNKNDKITYADETFRIDKVMTRRIGITPFYKFARLFLVT